MSRAITSHGISWASLGNETEVVPGSFGVLWERACKSRTSFLQTDQFRGQLLVLAHKTADAPNGTGRFLGPSWEKPESAPCRGEMPFAGLAFAGRTRRRANGAFHKKQNRPNPPMTTMLLSPHGVPKSPLK